MSIDVSREIRRAVDTGKVAFGEKEATKTMEQGKTALVVVSSNCKKETQERIEQASSITKIPVIHFPGTGLELGAVCGKPFTIGIMAIHTTGKSNILKAVK